MARTVMMMINSDLNLLVKLFIGPDSDNDWRTKICIIYVLRSTSQSQSNNCPLNWKYFPTIIRKHQMRSSGSSGSRSSPGPPERQALHASQHQLSTFSPREKGFFIVINDILINIIDIIDIFIILNIHKVNITAGSPHSSFFFTLFIFFLPAAHAIWSNWSEISRVVMFSADLKRCWRWRWRWRW